MEGESRTHQEYKGKKGERYPTSKPQDSDILRGEGAFASETQSGSEYTAKIGERLDSKRPGESEIWKVRLSLCNGRVSSTFVMPL